MLLNFPNTANLFPRRRGFTELSLMSQSPSEKLRFRSSWGVADPRVSNPAAGRLVTCENMTMGQFAENLSLIASGYIRGATVVNATELEGKWDFTISFSAAGIVNGGGAGRGAAPGPAGGAPAGLQAQEPNMGISLYEAIEKQLGLKLELTLTATPDSENRRLSGHWISMSIPCRF